MKRSILVDDPDTDDFKETKRSRTGSLSKKKGQGSRTSKHEPLLPSLREDSLSKGKSHEPSHKVHVGKKESNSAKEDASRCPICCFPFRHLVGVTKNWHVSECLETGFDGSKRDICPKGTGCTAFSISHYKKFLHFPKQDGCKGYEQSKLLSAVVKIEPITGEQFADNGGGSVPPVSLDLPVSLTDLSKPKDVPCRSVIASTIEVDMKGFDSVDDTSVRQSHSSNSSRVDNGEHKFTKCQRLNTVEYSGPTEKTTLESSAISGDVIIPCSRVNNEMKNGDTHSSTTNLISATPFSTDVNSCNEINPKKLKQTDIGVFFGSKRTLVSKVAVEEKGNIEEGKKNLTPSQWRWNGNQGKSSKDDNVNNTENNTSTNVVPRGRRGKQSCPFYKKIPDSPFTVDAFKYGEIPGCSCYFLSHFHYDHYGGLTKHFKGKVYCSKVTANLVIGQLRVPRENVVCMPMDIKVVVCGVKVTLLDANHCPGSVLFLFEFPNGRRILHTGDFRASQSMADYRQLKQKSIDVLYLDTTYCLPYYKFPTQQDTIDFAVKKATLHNQRQPKTLIICGTYTIGKEKVFDAIANALQCKVCVKRDKLKILSCLEWSDLEQKLTVDQKEAKVHVLPMNRLTIKHLQDYLESQPQVKEIVAFKPTGWTYTDKNVSLEDIKPITRPGITIYGIPYSEHSSYTELEWFVRFLKPKKIIPTVNVGSPEKREEMQRAFKDWLS